MRSTSVDVVGRALELVPLLEKHRGFSEEHARAAPEVIDACREAGLFAMAAPVEVGGLEATLADQFQVGAIISAVDPGVAWCVMNSVVCSRAGAWIDPQYWPTVYASLGTFGNGASPTGILEPVDGGCMLSGSWPLMTGVLDAQWAAVNCMLSGPDGRRVVRQAIIPTESLTIDRVWDTAVAMRGSGSQQVALPHSIFVPSGLIVDTNDRARIDRPLYRHSTLSSIVGINTGIVVGLLESGISSAALELKNKVSSIFGMEAASNAAIQELMADAFVALSHLRLGAKAALDTAWEYLERDELPPVELRAAITGAQFHGVDVARDIISRLYARSSRAAFFAGHPLERALRDVHAVAYGIETLRPMHYDVGRVALGLDPAIPSF